MQSARVAKISEHIESIGAERHLLQCDHVRFELTNHTRYALWFVLPIAAYADVNVIGSDPDAALSRGGWQRKVARSVFVVRAALRDSHGTTLTYEHVAADCFRVYGAATVG